MIDMHAPKSYWGDSLLIATYLINRMPSRILYFKTPLEVLSPPLSTSKCVFPKVFGCVCFVHIHSPTWGKLDPCALKCIFVGYSPTQKEYKCYNPPSWKHFISMDGNHILYPPTLLFRGRVQVKRSFLWVVLYPSLLLCQSMTNNIRLLTSLLLMSRVSHLQWRSWEFTPDARKTRPFLMLFAKHLTLTRVTILLPLI